MVRCSIVSNCITTIFAKFSLSFSHVFSITSARWIGVCAYMCPSSTINHLIKQFHDAMTPTNSFSLPFCFLSIPGIISYVKLTDLSPNCSTRHRTNAVWPTRAVTLRGTSKSKYGCSDIFESTRLLSAVVCAISENIPSKNENRM